MTTTLVAEDVIVFFIALVGILMYFRQLMSIRARNSNVTYPRIVLKFRWVSILLLGYFMIDGVCYQLGVLPKVFAMTMFAAGALFGFLGLQRLRSHVQALTRSHFGKPEQSQSSQQDEGGNHS